MAINKYIIFYMKKYFACAILLFCLLFAGCTAQNKVASCEETSSINAATASNAVVSYGKAYNVVIFICFSDEDPARIRATIPSAINEKFNGDDYSLKDYYDKLSYGRFSFSSLFPTYDGGAYFIYRDDHPRSYYLNNKADSGSGRTGPESKLLNNAVYEASAYLDLTGHNLDMNGDGYVDCVTFLVSGNYSDAENTWNTLMWPHSWQLDGITKEYNPSSASASIAGKKVNNYTFLFLDKISSEIGLLCHELGHAVGNLPDLYHYSKKRLFSHADEYSPVGHWDLMSLHCTAPQYMTTYIRQKYLSFIDDNQVREMEKSGDYTLRPVTTAGRDDVLAYTLTVDNGTATPNESIWIEYRRNDVTTYDSGLDGSGLIVYRVNTEAYPDGNKNGDNNSTDHPDELFVFRPDFSQKNTTKAREAENVSYAYLSKINPHFSSLGNATSKEKYDSNCIYLTNGKNTGIVITVKEETQESVTFHIELNNYDASEIDYAASYVKGNTNNKNEVEVYYGEDIRSKISLYVKRRNRGIYRADDASVTLLGGSSLNDVCEDGKNAYVEYTDDFGTYRFSFLLFVHDKLLIDDKSEYIADVLSLPNKTDYKAGESFSLRGLIIRAAYLSGDKTFSYREEENSKWKAIGFDMEKSGEQEVTVTYNDEVKVHFTIFVRSNVVSIRVDEKNTRHISGDSVQPRYNVVALYEDGMEKALSEGEYSVEKNTETTYGKTEVVLRSVDNGDAFCHSYYYAVPKRITALSLIADPKKDYRYGEALDLSAGLLQISFGTYPNGFSLDGENAVRLENYYNYITGYSPTRVGKQTIKLTIEDATLAIDVNVTAMPDQLYYTNDKSIRINESASTILLDKDHTLKTLSENISCYLNTSFTYEVGSDAFYVTADRYGDLPLQSDLTVQLTNDAGIVIKTYSVRRSGDGNDDGTISEKDIPYWERAIVAKEETTKGVLFDRNGDNRYTLTDYVMLMDELKEKK